MIGEYFQLPLHNEELHDFYASPNIIRERNSGIRWVGM
jgi:hypothetical protein